MKSKILIFIVTAALMISCMTVFASAKGGEYLLEFDTNEDFLGCVNANAMELSKGDNALDLTITGEVHPLIWMALGTETGKSAEPLNADEYHFMKIRYNSECEDDVLRFFWGVYTNLNEHPGPNFADHLIYDFEIEHQAGWKSGIFDMSELVGDLWSGYISAIRFDIDPISDSVNLTSESEGLIFSIDYIAFFKTAEEAAAFRSDLDTATAEVTTAQDTTAEESKTKEQTTVEEQTTAEEQTTETTATEASTTEAADVTTEESEDEKGLSSAKLALIIVAAAVVAAIIASVIIIGKAKKKVK